MKWQETIQREILEQYIDRELEGLVGRLFQKTVQEAQERELYTALLYLTKGLMRLTVPNEASKKVYYISSEFLTGRLLANSLINLGVYERLEGYLAEKGKSLSRICQIEPEPGLGKGGPGHLAACMMESIASLGLPGEGIGLNYHFGWFRQVLRDGQQTEEKDLWMERTSWLTRTDLTFDVRFGDGKVTSRLYNLDVIGYENGVSRLRLFDLEGLDETLAGDGISFDKSLVWKNLTLFCDFDDSDEAGRLLRFCQQYFLVSSAVQLILKEMKEKQYDLRRMYDYAVIQLNDTEPSLIIPELIRILVEDKAFSMDDAIQVVRRTCAYTTHSLRPDLLGSWSMRRMERVVPQLIPILRELSRRIGSEFSDPAVQIIDADERVRMANLNIHYGFSVNGVSAHHMECLKNGPMNDLYRIYPEKFRSETGGISFRRWLMCANRELAELITYTIGRGWKNDWRQLEKLLDFDGDEAFLQKLLDVKRKKKEALSAFLAEKEGIRPDPDSVFDMQTVSLRGCGPQLLNALYIIHKYLEIRDGKRPVRPLTFLFGAKAEPTSRTALDTVHLLWVLGQIIDRDPAVQGQIQVILAENYDISYAEMVTPAGDISEQVSLSRGDASGVGCMKFMLNGALTLGSLEGICIEICGLTGEDNFYVFRGGMGQDNGASQTDSAAQTAGTVQEGEAVQKDGAVREGIAGQDVWAAQVSIETQTAGAALNGAAARAVAFLVGEEALASGNGEILRRVHGRLLEGDCAEIPALLDEYISVKDRMLADYEDRLGWARRMLVNIAKAGFFSADRTVEAYNRDIWKVT